MGEEEGFGGREGGREGGGVWGEGGRSWGEQKKKKKELFQLLICSRG